MMETKQDVAFIFKTLKQLLQPPNEKRRMISFKSSEENEAKTKSVHSLNFSSYCREELEIRS